MKAKYFFLKKIQLVTFVLTLVAILLVGTTALAAEGMLDPTFGTDGVTLTDLGSSYDGGMDIVLQPDGKFVVLGSTRLDDNDPDSEMATLARYNSDGTLDNTFGTDGKQVIEGEGSRVYLQPGGKLIVATPRFLLTRYTSNGTLDDTFDTTGVEAASYMENGGIDFHDLAIQADGKIVLVGTWETQGHTYPGAIARFNENGTLDEDFGVNIVEFPDGMEHFLYGVGFQSDGKIIMSGRMIPYNTDDSIVVGRFTTGLNPWFDPAFGTNGKVVTEFGEFQQSYGAMAIQPNDKIVIAGRLFDSGLTDLAFVRYNANGPLDTTFGDNGVVITDLGKNEDMNDLVIQRDSKIVVAVTSRDVDVTDSLLMRYNSDGSLDTTFGDAGKIASEFGGNYDSIARIALQPNGKILAVGAKDGDVFLARYEGTLPPTTTVTFNSKAASDGWILESTESSNVGGTLNKAATTFYVGDDPKDKQYRAILSFNTASLPDNAFLVSAQVKVKRQGIVGTNPFTTHGDLLLEIRNGLFSNDLGLRVGDFAAAPSSSTPETITPLTSTWYAANLSGSNLPFVNKYGVTQFRLRFDQDDNDDLSADYMKFFTGESITKNQPQLIVTYVVP